MDESISVVDAVDPAHLGRRCGPTSSPRLSAELRDELESERMCGQQSCRGRSAADGVQLVVETAETVMSGLCILVLIMVMRQIHRIYCSGAGDL